MSRSSPEVAKIIAHKDGEPAKILGLVKLPNGTEQYFRNAPPQCRYEYLARVVG